MKKKRLNMNTIWRIKFLCCYLMFSVMLRAQTGFLPEDKKHYTLNIGEHVVLGVPDELAGSKVCYRWSSALPETFVTDVNKPLVEVVAPQVVGEYCYTVTRIGQYVVEDHVILDVVEDFIIDKIINKRPCYNVGEKVEISDFSFETTPPNMGRFVELISPNEPLSCNKFKCEQLVVFVTNLNNNFHEYWYAVEVVNSEIPTVTLTPSIPKYIKDLSKSINESKRVYWQLENRCKKIRNGVNRLIKSNPHYHFEFSPNLSKFDASISTPSLYCCDVKAIGVNLTVGGGVELAAGVMFPVKCLGCFCQPLLAVPEQIKIKIGVEVGAMLNSSLDISKCMFENGIKFIIDVNTKVTGGLHFAHGDIIDCGLDLYAKPGAKITWTLPDDVTFNGSIDTGLTIVCKLSSFVDINKNIDFK